MDAFINDVHDALFSDAYISDGRLNFVEKGILAWMLLRPAGYKAHLNKLWAEGGGAERSGPSEQIIRHACMTLDDYGYAQFTNSILQLRLGDTKAPYLP